MKRILRYQYARISEMVYDSCEQIFGLQQEGIACKQYRGNPIGGCRYSEECSEYHERSESTNRQEIFRVCWLLL